MSGLNQVAADRVSELRAHSFYSKTASGAKQTKDPKAIAGQLESIFYRMLFKQVREASLGDALFDSPTMKTVKEMQDDEWANHLGGQGHLGIVKLVTDHIEKVEGERTVLPNEFKEMFGAPKGLLKSQERSL